MTIAAELEISPTTIVFSDVSWDMYQKLIKSARAGNARLTYDRGTLEMMAPLPEHEITKKLLARLVEAMTEELNIPVACLGSTTLTRKSLLKGLEPDECYYIRHERDVRGRKRLDLRRDPPPDLVIEVDVSHRTIDKRLIYAAMRVPEIWSYDSGKLEFLHLARGRYEARGASLAFPKLRPAQVERFLNMMDEKDQTTIVRGWRKWVRGAFGSDASSDA